MAVTARDCATIFPARRTRARIDGGADRCNALLGVTVSTLFDT